MNIHEGNLFEAMRLVLPEHRSAMTDWQRQRSVRKPPILSEDEIETLQYTLSEAIETRSRVRLTLFGESGDTVWEGVPIYAGRLRIVTTEGVQMVDGERLIAVEIMPEN